tara:strand:+ start:6170 stop:6874 length:705 start_codon:yes stop_codon:yes gene_type:complete
MAIERYVRGSFTKSGEFVYQYLDSDGKEVPVRKEQRYIQEQHTSKSIIYRLFTTGEIILKKNDSDMLATYKRIGNARKRDEYPVRSFPTSAGIGSSKFITRVFAKNKISDLKEVTEVVKATNSTSYMFTEMQWQVGGTLDQAIEYNRKQLIRASESIPELEEMIPLDQLHITKFESLVSKRPEYQNANPEQSEQQDEGQQEQTTQQTQTQTSTSTSTTTSTGTGGGSSGGGGGY